MIKTIIKKIMVYTYHKANNPFQSIPHGYL